MYGKKIVLMILFFVLLGSSALDARRVKRRPTAEQVWNNALKANDETEYRNVHKQKKYRSKKLQT